MERQKLRFWVFVAAVALLVMASGCGQLKPPSANKGQLIVAANISDAISAQFVGPVTNVIGQLTDLSTNTPLPTVTVTPTVSGAATLNFTNIPYGTYDLAVWAKDAGDGDKIRYSGIKEDIVINSASTVNTSVVLGYTKGSLKVEVDVAALSAYTISSVTMEYQHIPTTNGNGVTDSKTLTLNGTSGKYEWSGEFVPGTLLYAIKVIATSQATPIWCTGQAQIQLTIIPGSSVLRSYTTTAPVATGSGSSNITLAAIPDPPTINFVDVENYPAETPPRSVAININQPADRATFGARFLGYTGYYRPAPGLPMQRFADGDVQVDSSFVNLTLPNEFWPTTAFPGQYALASRMDDGTGTVVYGPLSNIETGECMGDGCAGPPGPPPPPVP